MLGLDPARVPAPCFVLDLAAMRRNLAVLESVRQRTGAKILLAQKAFSMYHVYGVIAQTLDGCCASSPHEARLAKEEFRKEVHSFAAAFSEQDLKELLTYSDHIVFNSLSQWDRFRHLTKPYQGKISFGLRCNPEHSEADVDLYSPCGPNSRLGIRSDTLKEYGGIPDGIEGLHFHALCQRNSDALERTLAAFEARFGEYIPGMKWVNFGGGHHITRADYDVDLLCRLITSFREKYGVETIYLEPGEAVVLNAGSLYAEILDITHNLTDIAVMNVSAECHTPDVLEMPYRPEIVNAGLPGEYPYLYRLAGHSCLAGDIMGDYSFPEPLKVGDRIELLDMALYSMVKTNTFNGLQLPSIASWDSESGVFCLHREFSFFDFKSRL